MPIHALKAITLAAYFGLLALLCIWIIATKESIAIPLALIFQPLLLIFPVKGLLAGKPYTYAWSSFLALYYFMLGVFNAADVSTRTYGLTLTTLSIVFFIGAISYANQQGKALKRQAEVQADDKVDQNKDTILEEDKQAQLIPWTHTIIGAFFLAPVGFLVSARWQSYSIILLFPFAFYFAVIFCGFFVSFGLKVFSHGRLSFSSISLLEWLNRFSILAGLIAIIWFISTLEPISS